MGWLRSIGQFFCSMWCHVIPRRPHQSSESSSGFGKPKMVMNSQWELFTTIPHNLSMWLESKSWWLGSKREQAKRKHPKRKEVKVPSLLRSGLRSHRILCRPYFIHQSNHRASPDSRRGEISLKFGHEKWHGYPQPYIYIYKSLSYTYVWQRFTDFKEDAYDYGGWQV